MKRTASYKPSATRKKQRITQKQLTKALRSTEELKDNTSGVLLSAAAAVDKSYDRFEAADSMFFGITQGTDADQRIGRTIRVKSIHIKAYAQAGEETGSFKIALVQDRSCQGNSLNPSRVWDVSVDGRLAFRNLDHTHQYKVLGQAEFKPNFGNSAGGNQVTAPAEIFLDNLDMVVRYDASTGAISDLTENNVALFVYGPVAGTNNVLASYRIRYTDA